MSHLRHDSSAYFYEAVRQKSRLCRDARTAYLGTYETGKFANLDHQSTIFDRAFSPENSAAPSVILALSHELADKRRDVVVSGDPGSIGATGFTARRHSPGDHMAEVLGHCPGGLVRAWYAGWDLLSHDPVSRPELQR